MKIENNNKIHPLVKEIKDVQIGYSYNADYYEYLWSFKLSRNFKSNTGTFALVPIILFNQVIMEIQRLQNLHNIKEHLEFILNGIDKQQSESSDGWWETSCGAEFGAKKLEEIINLIKSI